MHRNYRILAVGFLVFLLSLPFVALHAQPNGRLRMVLLSNDGSVLDVKVQVKGSAAFDMGTSNLVFTYSGVPDTAISDPTLLDVYNFNDGSYKPMTLTFPVSGRGSLNIFLSGSLPTSVGTSWMDVATLRFATKNKAGEALLGWKLSGPGRSYLYQAGTPATLLTVDTADGLDVTPLPIELSSFSAHFEQGGALLRWTTALETNSFGFNVQRATEGAAFETIGFIPARNTGMVAQSYAYRDATPPPSGEVRYRLLLRDTDGSERPSPAVVLSRDHAGAVPRLLQIYPNPASGNSSVQFTLGTPSTVRLALTDITGREVLRIHDGERLPAGNYVNSLNVAQLPSGWYTIHFSADGFRQTAVLVRAK